MRELTSIFSPFHAVFAAGSTYHSIQAACYQAPYVCMLGTHCQHVHKATQNHPLSVTVISSLPNILPCPKNFLYQMQKWPLNPPKKYILYATDITISCNTRRKKNWLYDGAVY